MGMLMLSYALLERMAFQISLLGLEVNERSSFYNFFQIAGMINRLGIITRSQECVKVNLICLIIDNNYK